ncbi:hypothetical protein HK097_010583 [Rhizophlyctis rosea]|uniref:BTB domain-containing protein n=1 Tax=Rhizophlyctis rosea TaxID=64517 RepID=A0AAD5SK95_9FUNG|nr:hypothetical protein HK097_010583 [Rhizophlyctis rosea]
MTTTASLEDYPDLIDLDLGGKHFRTTRSTLVTSPMLESLVTKHWKERSTAGAIFIDRSPDMFQIILDWLREGTITHHLPSDDQQKKQFLQRLRAEARYYLLTELEEDISSILAQPPAKTIFSPNLYVRFCRIANQQNYNYNIVPVSNACAVDAASEITITTLTYNEIKALEHVVDLKASRILAKGYQNPYEVSKLYRSVDDEFSVLLIPADGAFAV